MKICSSKVLARLGAAILLLVIIIASVIVVVYFTKQEDRLIARGAVVTNGFECAEIGTSIMLKGGNAADVAIATLFCEGVSMPQSMGLGGGFLLTMYNKTTKEVWTLNAREVAPIAATVDMYQGDATLSHRGGKAVAVPGELLGYWHLYNRFGGKLPWKELVQPTIDLCYKGIYVTSFLQRTYQSKKELLYKDPVLRDIFIDPTTNDTYVEGQYVQRLRLAKTLEIIAVEGGYALHNGSLTEAFVKDIKDNDGIITVEDLNSYKPEWKPPVKARLLNNQTIYSSPLPGAGVILSFILNILSNFIDVRDPNSVTTYQRIVESFKFGYAKRTLLGDSDFVNLREVVEDLTSKGYAEKIRKYISDNETFQDPSHYGASTPNVEDHGTAHISIVTPNGDAVAITSTINFVFGAGFASNSTGIILNDEMEDFSSPSEVNGASPANFVAPGKRPLSSMCPSIILDDKDEVVLVTGAAGGIKITTSVALVIIKHLWFGMGLKAAVDDKRFHHQLFPMQIDFESSFAKEAMDLVEKLHALGHNYTITQTDGFAAVTAVSRLDPKTGEVVGVFDRRRPGSVSYIF